MNAELPMQLPRRYESNAAKMQYAVYMAEVLKLCDIWTSPFHTATQVTAALSVMNGILGFAQTEPLLSLALADLPARN